MKVHNYTFPIILIVNIIIILYFLVQCSEKSNDLLMELDKQYKLNDLYFKQDSILRDKNRKLQIITDSLLSEIAKSELEISKIDGNIKNNIDSILLLTVSEKYRYFTDRYGLDR